MTCIKLEIQISSKLHMHVMSTILFKICQNTGWVQESSRYVWKEPKSTNPSILTADPVIQAKSKAGSITSTQASGEAEETFELPDVLSDLKGGIFAKGLLQLLEELRPTPYTTGGFFQKGTVNIGRTVEPPVSDHPECKEVVVYKNRTTGGLFWEEVNASHIYFMEDNLLHAMS